MCLNGFVDVPESVNALLDAGDDSEEHLTRSRAHQSPPVIRDRCARY